MLGTKGPTRRTSLCFPYLYKCQLGGKKRHFGPAVSEKTENRCFVVWFIGIRSDLRFTHDYLCPQNMGWLYFLFPYLVFFCFCDAEKKTNVMELVSCTVNDAVNRPGAAQIFPSVTQRFLERRTRCCFHYFLARKNFISPKNKIKM